VISRLDQTVIYPTLALFDRVEPKEGQGGERLFALFGEGGRAERRGSRPVPSLPRGCAGCGGLCAATESSSTVVEGVVETGEGRLKEGEEREREKVSAGRC
jgi:hypothetical protein